MKRLLVYAAGVFAVGICPGAHATPIDINLAYSNGSGTLDSGYWSTVAPASGIANASKSGNTSTGVTFANWSGRYNEIATGQTTVFALGNLLLGDTTTFKTLINTFYGDALLDAVVTFTNSANATAVYSLVGGSTVRDYNYNVFQNSLSGGSTTTGVTAQSWWSNGSAGQVLDMQTFLLPASWAGTNLTSFQIRNTSPTADTVLSAAQLTTNAGSSAVTPEPSSLLLFGTGLIGIVGIMWPRLASRKREGQTGTASSFHSHAAS